MTDSKLTPKKSLAETNADSYKLQKVQTGLSAANLHVSAQSLKSLRSIENAQQEIVQLQNHILDVNYQQLDHLEQIAEQGKDKEIREKIAIQEKQIRDSHKELIFNLYSDLAEFDEKNMSLAEKYYRTRTMVYSLESNGITSESFDDINDKLFLGKINKKISKITDEAESSDDEELKKFIVAVEQFFYAYLKPAINADTISDEFKLKKIKAEKELINEFLKGFDKGKFFNISELDPPETRLPKVLKFNYVFSVLKYRLINHDGKLIERDSDTINSLDEKTINWFFDDSSQSYNNHIWFYHKSLSPAMSITKLDTPIITMGMQESKSFYVPFAYLTCFFPPIMFMLTEGDLWVTLSCCLFAYTFYRLFPNKIKSWEENNEITDDHVELCRKEFDKLEQAEDLIIQHISKVSKDKDDYRNLQKSANDKLKSFADKYSFLKRLFYDL